MNLTKFLSIPVIAVILLMGSVYYVTVFFFIEDWMGLQSSAGFLNALIFTLLASLCLFSLSACVLTEPGRVPSSYLPDVEESRGSEQEMKNYGPQKRLCDKCDSYRPPRAHHCRVCRRCVLRMDHHCSWINNCVGYWNYKAFFLLVLYGTIASVHSTAMIVCGSLHKDWNGRVPFKTFYVACAAIMTSLSLILGTLMGWHIYLTIHNMTTIEYYEAQRASWLARKSGQKYQHPFDLSPYANITLVLGSNMLKWLCPTAVGHLKDGLSFPISHDGS